MISPVSLFGGIDLAELRLGFRDFILLGFVHNAQVLIKALVGLHQKHERLFCAFGSTSFFLFCSLRDVLYLFFMLSRSVTLASFLCCQVASGDAFLSERCFVDQDL